jgi:exopolyphosphatase/guanosine-5'-triphosphate,3'-diphosphate pyrophosphatase
MRSKDSGVYSVIDLGTNTCLLLVASLNKGKLTTLFEAQEVPRIGKGIYDTNRISSDSFEKAREIFEKYRRISEEYNVLEINAFGTSALRDAINSKEFVDFIRSKTGVEIRVISGNEEAECAFLGAVYDLPEDDYAVIDIGGGSTEISCRDSGMLINESVNIGSVRLTEMFFADGYSAEALSEAGKFTEDSLRRIPLSAKGKKPVGVAGTLTTLSAIRLSLKEFDIVKVHGDVITLDEVSEITHRLIRMNEQERLSIGSYMKGRSDIIVSGALILRILMEKLGAANVRISAKGLRYGLMLSLDAFSKSS